MEKFIEENLERDISSFEITDDLYERYLMFCEFHKVDPFSRIKFAHSLGKLNVGVTDKRLRKGKVVRWGVRLLPCKY